MVTSDKIERAASCTRRRIYPTLISFDFQKENKNVFFLFLDVVFKRIRLMPFRFFFFYFVKGWERAHEQPCADDKRHLCVCVASDSFCFALSALFYYYFLSHLHKREKECQSRRSQPARKDFFSSFPFWRRNVTNAKEKETKENLCRRRRRICRRSSQSIFNLFSIFWSFSIPISLRHVLNAKESDTHIGQSKQTEKDMRSCDWTVPPPLFRMIFLLRLVAQSKLTRKIDWKSKKGGEKRKRDP